MAVATQPSLAAQLQNFGLLSNGQKIGFIIAAAAIIALFSGAFLWYQTPSYQVLYTSLSEKDGGAVINALQAMNVPFKAEGTSAIKVPLDKVYEVRLKLAAQGIPKGGAGFDLLDKQKLGVSQFIEQVNFQRALEGELVRTIEAVSSVQGARVHLAIPRPSVFLRDQQKPSASVFLNLGGGKRLDPSQVSGIVHLVSSSVADLSPQNITVVDQNGNLLIAPDVHGNKAGLDPTQLEFMRQLEGSYIARIESIVAPIVGRGNVRAQVNADLDFAQTEQTAETFKPNPTPQDAAIRSQQTSDSAGGAGATAAGVPGALSNQPPGAASAPITAPPGAAPVGGVAAASTPASPPAAGARESTVNYEVDKTVRRTKLPVGSVKRLSTAVVVNYKQKTAEDGKVSLIPLTEPELMQINNLVKEAVGFSQPRGDSLNVVNAAFNLPPPETVEEIAFWEKPRFEASAMAVLKFIGIAIVLWLLVTRFLMPILRQLAIPPPALPMEDKAPSKPAREAVVYQDNLQAARQIARQDPKVVATVVKEWVGSE